ncbi:MAG: gliding motility-associated C-terminal domain-containing protein [Flavobacteriales bacterium]
MMLRTICLLMGWSLAALCLAQPANDDCNDAALLCADQPLTGNNTGATGWPGFCSGTGNLLWYSFTTNNQGGTVDIAISGIDCPAIAGMDNELSVIVLSGDGSCLPNTFNAESPCVADSQDFVLTSDPLAPNTQYWVIVAGAQNNGATQYAQCDFTVNITGPGADIVNVDFDAGDDLEIAEGQTVQLDASGGTTYNWTPNTGLTADDIPDPFATPNETTLYTVTTMIDGCTYSDVVLVEVIRLIDVVNTFTPNGDGINDTWTIRDIEDYPNARIIVYDRWGQRVYSTTGYDEPWDGTNKGAKLPTAAYYYHIQLNKLEGQVPPFVGCVTIIR